LTRTKESPNAYVDRLESGWLKSGGPKDVGGTNHNAGVPRELISSITGHEPKRIDDVLAHYTARTADQAATALNMRLAHEAKGATP